MNGPTVPSGQRAVSGLMWTAGGYATQAVAQFAVLALLARFLTPTEFGLVSAALVVIGLVRILTDSLLGPAVTQHPELTDAHVRTAFTLSVGIGAVASVAMWWAAGTVAAAFAMPGLAPVVRGLAPLLLVDALSTVPIALLQRDLAFRRLAMVETVSLLLGFAVPGCVLAVTGAGVDALVIAQLAYVALRSVLVLVLRPQPWTPRVDRRAATDLLRYGGGHTLGKVFNYAALQGDYVVIGRWLSAAALGIYGRAYQLAVKPAMFLGQALDRVMFPMLAALQHDRPRLAEAYRRTLSLSASVTAPASVVAVVLGPEIVRVVLGGGWDEVIVPFQILAAGLVFRMGYKPADSLARALDGVYQRAWRQAVYATLVVLGAFVGSRWGLEGVAAFVVAAILANHLMMASLSLRLVGLRWPAFVTAHGRAAALAAATTAVCLPTATLLRSADAAPIVVLAGTLLALGLVAWLAITRDAARVLGPDLMWLATRVGSRLPTRRRARPQGVIVAVVGADGSGKSTLTTDLVTELGRARHVDLVYLGSGQGPAAWYRVPMKVVRDRVRPPDARKHDGAPEGQSKPPDAFRTLWATALAMEKIGKTRRAARARARGAVVVCDRYPQTQFPGGNDGPLLHGLHEGRSRLLRALARWEARAYDRAAGVRPDLVLKLDVSLDAASGRRPGLPSDYLAGRILLIQNLDFGCPTVVLDATAPYEAVREQAVAAIATSAR